MLPVMNSQSRLKWTAPLFAAGVIAATLGAQEPPPALPLALPQPADAPPPAPPRPQDKAPGEGKDRHDWRGRGGPDGDRHGSDRRGPPGKSMSGRPPMWGEGFEKLSEDEKRRVREALGKAWGRPEVAAAREKLMAANDEMRRAINEALKEIDPQVAQILQNMRGPEGRGEPPRLPPVESEAFPVAVLKRLEAELLTFSPPERREAVRDLHARLLANPVIDEAVQRLNQAGVSDRIKAMEDLRKIYRETVSEELRKLREEGGKKADAPSAAAGADPGK